MLSETSVRRSHKRGEVSAYLFPRLGRGGPIGTRFWQKVELSDGCWIWKGSIASNGYGCLRINRRTHTAHTVSWQLLFGPIPPGRWVCHRCDVRACVNQSHLFLGDAQVNVTDMIQKGRRYTGVPRRAEAHPRARLTASDVRQIRAAKAAGDFNASALGRIFGVSATTVNVVATGRGWASVQ